MLSNHENEMMCRTDAGTPMGKAMRQIWVPALMSEELPEPDCDPVYVQLLGGSYVAFRDSNGNVGLLDEMCCHRGVSLTIGRSENCGLRCVYHGWLFGTDGTVLETPNIPEPNFKTRFKAKAYPVREAGGLIWTYLGDADELPPFHDFPYLDAPASKRLTTLQVVGCNYVQAMEGLLDSTHLSVLHISQLKRDDLPKIKFVQGTEHMKWNATPKIEVEATSFGLTYGALRATENSVETNVTAFIAPFFVLNPMDVHMAVVPMTDESCALYSTWYDGTRDYGLEPLKTDQRKVVGLDQLDGFGMSRKSFYETSNHPSRANGFRQDRALMREGHHTGVTGFVQEDAVVCVSAGAFRSREIEYLGSADMAIAMMYRTLITSAKQVAAGAKPVAYGMSVANLRGAHASLAPGVDWRTLVPGNLSRQDVA